jgi:hypothetical protein
MADNPIETKLKAAYATFYELADEPPPAGRDSVVTLSPAPAAKLPEERVISVTVYVLGINEEYDEPDLFVTQVTCTEQEYYEEGEHLAMAEGRAREAGFVDPLFSFDERESRVTEKLGKLFAHRKP